MLGLSCSSGGLIARAGFDETQPASFAKRKNARRRSNFLRPARGASFHCCRKSRRTSPSSCLSNRYPLSSAYSSNVGEERSLLRLPCSNTRYFLRDASLNLRAVASERNLSTASLTWIAMQGPPVSITRTISLASSQFAVFSALRTGTPSGSVPSTERGQEQRRQSRPFVACGQRRRCLRKTVSTPKV